MDIQAGDVVRLQDKPPLADGCGAQQTGREAKMDGNTAAEIVRNERKFLNNVLKDFKPENGDFRATDDMMTVTQQIRHIAVTAKWFREGAFGAGFDMDFEKLDATLKEPATLEEALAELDAVYDANIAFLESLSAEELQAPMSPNPLFGEAPRMAVISAEVDHTAHHRGALSVYLRLLGVTPTMVYAV